MQQREPWNVSLFSTFHSLHDSSSPQQPPSSPFSTIHFFLSGQMWRRNFLKLHHLSLRASGKRFVALWGNGDFGRIGSWQLGFAMETRRLPRVPRPNPKGHCLWWCSHPLLNRFTFCSTLSNWVFFGFLLTSVWNEGKRVENKSFKKSTSSFHSLFNKTEEKTSLSVFSFFLFIYDKISYAIIQP